MLFNLFKKDNSGKKPKSDPVPEPRVAFKEGAAFSLNAVVGNVTLGKNSVISWFTVDPKSVSFRPDLEIENIIQEEGAALANLVSRRVYFRVTSRPAEIKKIADDTWRDAVERTRGPIPGADEMIAREQGMLWESDLLEKFVFLGVRVATSRRFPSDPRREVQLLKSELEGIESVARSLNARRSSLSEMDLLLRRSFALSLPLPDPSVHTLGDWNAEDLPSLVSDVSLTSTPWSKTSTIGIVDQENVLHANKVAVLTMGRIGKVSVPQDGQGGWIHRADKLPFPVEWMATIDVLEDEKVNDDVRGQIDLIADQYKHYTVEHGKPAPRSLTRQNNLALAVEDELNAGLGGLATRTRSWIRVAVWGQTEEEIQAKVAVLRALYGRQIEWWWSSAQYDLLREFMPCEPLANSAECRRMTTPSVMAALPAATAQIGDGYGIVLGQTAGTSRKPMIWAPWRDMEERNRSGLTVITGGLGSGKSVTGGLIVYQSCMLGARWTIFDPSGRLMALCNLPELKKYARHTNLLSGRDGELSPYRVLRDVRLEHFADPKKSDLANRQEFQQAQMDVEGQRKSLCLDVLTGLLPKALRQDSKALSVLRFAVNEVPGKRTSSPNMVLDKLQLIVDGKSSLDWTQEHQIAARDVLTELKIFAQNNRGRLVFGESTEDLDTSEEDIRLQVYSLHGLRIPTARQMESGDESSAARQGQVLFNLAAWLTQQSIYLGNKDERKGLFIDEAHLLSQFEEGTALMEKSSVDSRKHNCRVLLCSQNVNHFDVERIAPLVSAVIIGRTTTPSAAKDALTLAGLAKADSYIKMLASLTKQPARVNPDDEKIAVPHEFLFSTVDLGTVEKIVVKGDQHPHVMEALNSTPNS